MKLIVTIQDDSANIIKLEIDTEGVKWDDKALRLGSITQPELVVLTPYVVSIGNVESA